MTSLNIIAIVIIVVAIAGIAGIAIYKRVKSGETCTLSEFVDLYGDDIINVLKDIVDILQVDMANYETQEEYEKAVINGALMSLKNNSVGFGISENLVEIFDTEALTEVIQDIFCENKCDVMSVLDTAVIIANSAIIDKEVVEVIGGTTAIASEE